MTEWVDEFDGGSSPIKIQAWIGYDEDYIYFAAKVEKDPGTVRSTRFRPNQGVGNDDRFTIGFDARAIGSVRDVFLINANRGSSISLAGGRAAKVEWIGEFDSVGRVTETGFEAECRIPWRLISDLRPGRRDINILIEYDDPVTEKEYTLWRVGNDSNLQAKWTDVDVPEVDFPRVAKILGYGYVGATDGESFESGAGLDFKVPLTTSLTAVGTLNPDSRNIQNSILGIDFDYLERLAGENRPFFDEGAGYFPSGIFASQRIRTIDAGFKLYGQVTDRLGIGALTTFDFGNERVSVVSARGSTPSQFGYSASFVDYDVPGRRSRAMAFNTSQRIGAFSVSAGHSLTDDELRGYGTNTNFSLSRGGGGWNFNFGWREVSANFFPRAGFAPERNFRRYAVSGFRFAQYRTGPLRSLVYGASWQTSSRLTGEKYRGGIDSSVSMTFRNDLSLSFERDFSYFGNNSDNLTSLYLSYPSNNPDRYVYAGANWGKVNQDDYTLASFGFGYKFDEKLRWFLNADVRRHTTNAEQLTTTLNYDLDAFQAVSFRAVYDQGRWNPYVTYRMSGNRGNEYFLIFGDPASDQFRRRLAFKMSVPWEIRF
jgi:hypothetical protein